MDNKIFWTAIFAFIAIFSMVVIVYIKGFKQWLIWAVTEAEAELGSGTGQLKLRYVYDLAVSRFPIIAKLIPFNKFSKMVDEALDFMREMIKGNKKLAAAINGK